MLTVLKFGAYLSAFLLGRVGEGGVYLIGGDFMPGGLLLGAADEDWALFGNRLVGMVSGSREFLVNLECPAMTLNRPLNSDKTLLYCLPQAIPHMRELGITAVNLANNHIMDYGPDALRLTISLLEANGIGWFGAGNTLAEASRPLVWDAGNFQIMNLAFGWVPPQMQEGSLGATATESGICPLVPSYVEERIRKFRKPGSRVWLHLHWGEEFTRFPSAFQVEQVRRFWDAGADLIIGHHPHIVQGMFNCSGKQAYMSLGNFLFAPRRSFDGGRTQTMDERAPLLKWPRHLYIGQLVGVDSSDNGTVSRDCYIRSKDCYPFVDLEERQKIYRVFCRCLGALYVSRFYSSLSVPLSVIEKFIFRVRKFMVDLKNYGIACAAKKILLKIRKGP